MFKVPKNAVLACVTAGLVLLASKYRNNVLQGVQQVCQDIANKNPHRRKSNKRIGTDKSNENISSDKIIVVESPEKCDYAIERIYCNLSNGVLGFDCEWVNEGPVSLLQLATLNGVCVLFRLNKIGYVPAKLKELLRNRQLLKVGVGSYQDAERLAKDYECKVLGTVDIRAVANFYSLPCPNSLASLCKHYLDKEMDKFPEVRCGNWNAENLTPQQIAYAAYDAYASVLLFHEILCKARQKRTVWVNLFLYIKSLQSFKKDDSMFDLPTKLVDTKFNSSISEKSNSNSSMIDKNNNTSIISDKKIDQVIHRNNDPAYKSAVPTRNKPLYHNCYLQAPDGDILCTCDRKKAEWYIAKNLGQLVQEEPFTVKLNFEPSGRALGQVGKYYIQVKVNQCVVCGASEKFVRKNVVPREYRKYFPMVMKSHQSHDVLLLCPACHEVSNCNDLQLRRKLADTCDASLINTFTNVREQVPKGLRMLQSAVKILKDGTHLPPERRKELEYYIMKFTGHKQVTPALLNALHEQFSAKSLNNCTKEKTKHNVAQEKPHGLKVVQYFEKKEGGLVELEKIWREHFLNTMKPRFLPELWSISHNQERLSICQSSNIVQPSNAKQA